MNDPIQSDPSEGCAVFSYFDNRDVRHILLEVEARGILEADKVLEEECGIVAAKTPGVGCTVGKSFTFTPMTDAKAEWIENDGYSGTWAQRAISESKL